MLGSCIDLQRKKRSIREASGISRNVHSTSDDLFSALFGIIFTNLIYAVNTAIVHVFNSNAVDKRTGVEVLSFSGARVTK